MNHEDEQLWNLLGSAKRQEAPKGFAGSIMQSIVQAEQAAMPHTKQTWFSWFKQSRHAWLSGASAACAAAIVCVLVIIGKDNTAQPVPIAAADIDDQLLLDVACNSLGSESEELQDALYQMATTDTHFLADQDLAELFF